jgi:hypothetical protein
VRQKRVGSLGSVLATEPIGLAERVRFWAEISDRFLALRIPEADAAKYRDRIAERIPGPSGEDGLRRLRTAAALRDLVDSLAGFDADPAVTDAIVALAREARSKTKEEV